MKIFTFKGAAVAKKKNLVAVKKKLQEAHWRKIYWKVRKLALRNKKRDLKLVKWLSDWVSATTNFAGISQWFKIVKLEISWICKDGRVSHLYQD